MASDPLLRERRMIRGWAHGLRSSTLRERRMFRGWALGPSSSPLQGRRMLRLTRLGPYPQILPATEKKDVTRLGPFPQILQLRERRMFRGWALGQFLPATEKKDVMTYEARPLASDPPRNRKEGCYEAGPMASYPLLWERRMLLCWAHGLRSSTKGKKDDKRLGPWLQILW
jgi:hypothetical protein